jgi:protein-S-isoprenylcysteine O-methyltransferase Ste14
MEFIPKMHIGWLNGWLLLVVFYSFFGLYLLSCSRLIVKKLYSVAGWSKREYAFSAFGKPFSLACIGLVIFSPLKFGTLVFWIGLIVYLAGTAVMFTALFEYRAVPVDEAVQNGIYRCSRNPQWVGLVLIFLGTIITTENGLALCIFCFSVVLYHFRVLGEERACLEAYGKPYQEYLDSVRRYF